MATRRVTYTVPADTAGNIEFVSKRLGITRSALVSQLLGEAVGDMVRLLQSIPEEPSEGDVRRFRGESADVIRERMAKVQELIEGDGLFGGRS